MIEASDLKYAQLKLLSPRMGKSLKLFLLLWEDRGKTVPLHQLKTRYQIRYVSSTVYTLRLFLQEMGWPVEIKTEHGVGYSLHVVDLDWSWETLPELCNTTFSGAAKILATTPDLPRRAAIILQILWEHSGKTVTYTDISTSYQSVVGRKATQCVIDEAINLIRQAIQCHSYPISLRNIAGIGYRLESPKPYEDEPPEVVFGEARYV